MITRYLASQMENCIKKTHIEVTKRYPKGKILEINGGAACFSGFDSYLSHVIGWGFATQSKQFLHEIKTIEHFYQVLNYSRVDIDLCSFVGNELPVFLSQRGYQISELNNVSFFDLKKYEFASYSLEPFLIREINQEEINKWSKKVALGFDAPEVAMQFTHYIQSHGARAYAAYHGDELIAGATIAMHGDFCDLGVTSTLPAYRNKGLQKKLVQIRLNAAKREGLSWATVTTEPGSISDGNVQKIGFHCAYTRIKMTRFIA